MLSREIIEDRIRAGKELAHYQIPEIQIRITIYEQVLEHYNECPEFITTAISKNNAVAGILMSLDAAKITNKVLQEILDGE